MLHPQVHFVLARPQLETISSGNELKRAEQTRPKSLTSTLCTALNYLHQKQQKFVLTDSRCRSSNQAMQSTSRLCTPYTRTSCWRPRWRRTALHCTACILLSCLQLRRRKICQQCSPYINLSPEYPNRCQRRRRCTLMSFVRP